MLEFFLYIGDVNKERSDLKSLNSRLFKLNKKGERLSELKKIFLDRMLEAEKDCDVDKFKQYYLASFRSIKLSYLIYHNIFEVVVKDFYQFKEIYSFIVNNREYDEYVKLFRQNSQLDSPEFETLLKSNNEVMNFLRKVEEELLKLSADNFKLFKVLEARVMEQKNLLSRFEDNPEIIDEKIKEMREYRKSLEVEMDLENIFNSEIKKLFDIIENFLGKGNSNLVAETNIFLNFLKKDLKQTGEDLKVGWDYSVGKGRILEKNAALFAAVVVLLSGVSVIGSLAGLGVAAEIFHGAFASVATFGEMLQSLPFIDKKVKEMYKVKFELKEV